MSTRIIQIFKLIEGDLRNYENVKIVLKDCTNLIHLDCISDEPNYELNPTLGEGVNFKAFSPHLVWGESSTNLIVKQLLKIASTSTNENAKAGIKVKNPIEYEMSLVTIEFINKIERKRNYDGYDL